jgi:hypothetical protein
MKRHEDGSFSKPEISGMPEGSDNETDVQPLGANWQLFSADTAAGAGQ